MSSQPVAVTDRPVVLEGGTLLTPDREIPNARALVERGRVVRVGSAGEVAAPGDALVVKAKECVICPGFIDLHIQGAGGADFLDGSLTGLSTVSAQIAAGGTTSFLATTTTGGPEDLEHLRFLGQATGQREGGATLLGIHLEGPYINPRRAGGFGPQYIRRPDPDELSQILEAAEGSIRLVTLAPEVSGALALVRRLTQLGICVSLGHSEASYDQVVEAIGEGLTQVTHLFNAMSGMHHREPGAAGAALARDELSVQLIADGHHVHPALLRLVVRAKGLSRVLLITDSTAAAGMPDGAYRAAGQEVKLSGGAVRLADGTLSGSVLTMCQAVKNMHQLAGAPLRQAVAMASLNPAKAIGIDEERGTVEEGKVADIVVLDRALDVQLTMVDGRVVFFRAGGPVELTA